MGINQISLNTVYNDNAYKAHIKDAGNFIKDADERSIVLDYETWYDFKIELIVLDASSGAGKIKISLSKSGETLTSIYESDVTISSASKVPTQVRIQRTSSQAATSIYFDDTIFYGQKVAVAE